jgi:hypothetical protein
LPVTVFIVLQNLFNVYGPSFGESRSDRTLLYAALHFKLRFSGLMTAHAPDEEVTQLVLRSKFNHSLMAAIQKDQLTERHLFAIYLVLNSFIGDENLESTHKMGFVSLLGQFIKKSEKDGHTMEFHTTLHQLQS